MECQIALALDRMPCSHVFTSPVKTYALPDSAYWLLTYLCSSPSQLTELRIPPHVGRAPSPTASQPRQTGQQVEKAQAAWCIFYERGKEKRAWLFRLFEFPLVEVSLAWGSGGDRGMGRPVWRREKKALPGKRVEQTWDGEGNLIFMGLASPPPYTRKTKFSTLTILKGAIHWHSVHSNC